MLDVTATGRRFTWYNSNGSAMSHIDRALIIKKKWSNNQGYVAWWVLSRDISDHYLLVFKVGDRGWGPNPFCFNNFWLEDMKFKQVVEDVQENQNVRFDESGVENKT